MFQKLYQFVVGLFRRKPSTPQMVAINIEPDPKASEEISRWRLDEISDGDAPPSDPVIAFGQMVLDNHREAMGIPAVAMGNPSKDDWLKKALIEAADKDPESGKRDFFNEWTGQSGGDGGFIAQEIATDIPSVGLMVTENLTHRWALSPAQIIEMEEFFLQDEISLEIAALKKRAQARSQYVTVPQEHFKAYNLPNDLLVSADPTNTLDYSPDEVRGIIHGMHSQAYFRYTPADNYEG